MFGLYVIVKGIISPYLAVFSCLKISRSSSLALNMLGSISGLGYFCSSKGFSFTFSFSTMVYLLLPRENGMFIC